MIDQFQDRIIYAQAMNCAAQVISSRVADSGEVTEEQVKELIKDYREWFYEELCKTPPRTLAESNPQGRVLEPAGPKKNNPLKYRAAKWTAPQLGDDTPGTIDQVYGVGDPPVGAKAEGYEGGESVSGQQ